MFEINNTYTATGSQMARTSPRKCVSLIIKGGL